MQKSGYEQSEEYKAALEFTRKNIKELCIDLDNIPVIGLSKDSVLVELRNMCTFADCGKYSFADFLINSVAVEMIAKGELK